MTIEEAIKVLENGEWWNMLKIPETQEEFEANKKMHDALDEAISALRVQQEAEKREPSWWISAKDRLPETSGNYLAFRANGVVMILSYSNRYRKFNAHDMSGGDSFAIADVTHWMPLTESPKGGGGV